MKLVTLPLVTLALVVATFISNTPVAYAYDYKLLFDKHESPYAGSTYFISAYNFYKYLDDRYVPSSAGKTDPQWILGRTGKVLLEEMLGSFFMVFQHEVFGHGYRAREFDFSYLHYSIGINSGATYFDSQELQGLNTYQQNAMIAGGLEANSILAQEIRAPWFKSNKIDRRDGLFYFLNQLGQFNYVYITQPKDLNYNNHYSNDIDSYINGVNRYYANNNVLTHKKMRTAVLFDLLDPTLFYSVFGLAKYLYDGSPTTSMHMLDIKGYKYLPIGRMLMAPFGLEFQVQNMIKTPRGEFAQINLRFGSNSNTNTAGIDFNVSPVWQYKKISVGNKFSIWYQPNMSQSNSYQSRTPTQANSRIGFAEFVSLENKFKKNFSVIADVGYKTAGYLPGFSLSNGVILRVGCKW